MAHDVNDARHDGPLERLVALLALEAETHPTVYADDRRRKALLNEAAKQLARLREAITGLLESDVGRQTLQKLADGQGTNTADGSAWMRAAEMMRPNVELTRGHDLNWKDISSHSQRDKDRTPKTWELRLAGMRVLVTRHVHFAPDEWVMTCDPWFSQHTLGRVSADDAKAAAVDVVRAKLTEAVTAFTCNEDSTAKPGG